MSKRLPAPPAADRTPLLEALGVQLDEELFTLALTHRSYAYEAGGLPTNERLEFLGDSVLASASPSGCTSHPEKPEGELAKIRASVVNMYALARVAPEAGGGRPRRAPVPGPRRGADGRPRQGFDPRRRDRGAARRRAHPARDRHRPRGGLRLFEPMLAHRRRWVRDWTGRPRCRRSSPSATWGPRLPDPRRGRTTTRSSPPSPWSTSATSARAWVAPRRRPSRRPRGRVEVARCWRRGAGDRAGPRACLMPELPEVEVVRRGLGGPPRGARR